MLSKLKLNKIKTDYIKGEGSLSELSSKYNVPLRTLQPIATKDNWVDSRNTVAKSVSINIEKSITELVKTEIIQLTEDQITRVKRFNSKLDAMINDSDRSNEILDLSKSVEIMDNIARRNLGIDKKEQVQPAVHLNFNSMRPD